MRHTARSLFVEVALPAFEVFITYLGGREMGLRQDTKNAAVVAEALLNLSEYVFDDLNQPEQTLGYQNSLEYRKSFWPTCKSYEIVCDFANAWKHKKTGRKGRTISSLDSVKENHVFIQYKDDEGFYYASNKMLTIILLDGSECNLAMCLGASMAIWSCELLRREFIPKVPELPKMPSYLLRRSDRLKKLRVNGYVGEHLEVHNKMLIFRPELGIPTPAAKGEPFHCRGDVEFNIIHSPVSS